MTLRLWDLLGAQGLLALAAIFGAGGRWLESSIVLLASVLGVLTRANLVERGIAGGHATSRAHLLAAQTAVLFLTYVLVVGLLVVAAVSGWTSDMRGAVATYSLIVLAFVLYRDMDSRLKRAFNYLVGGAAEARVGTQLDRLRSEGWWVAHDVPQERSGNIDHLVWCDRADGSISGRSEGSKRMQLGRNTSTARGGFSQ